MKFIRVGSDHNDDINIAVYFIFAISMQLHADILSQKKKFSNFVYKRKILK